MVLMTANRNKRFLDIDTDSKRKRIVASILPLTAQNQGPALLVKTELNLIIRD